MQPGSSLRPPEATETTSSNMRTTDHALAVGPERPGEPVPSPRGCVRRGNLRQGARHTGSAACVSCPGQNSDPGPWPGGAGVKDWVLRHRKWVAGGALTLVVIGIVLIAQRSDSHRPPVLQRIAAGRAHTCAVNLSGVIRCWGDNSYGQLGNGTTEASSAPVSVTGISNAIAISGSGNHTCAMTSTGTVLCWGANDSGQLGDGGTTASSLPIPVAAVGDGVRAVSASTTHSCAVTRSRAVWCWGDNGSGQRGVSESAPDTAPTAVAGLPDDATDIAVGNGFTCVVLATGATSCWGDNGDGQLGLGDTQPRKPGELVAGLPATASISAGDTHACGVTLEGGVMCWGANFAGQVGVIKAAKNALTPMGASGLGEGNAVVAAGFRATCATTIAGHVTCWGGSTDDEVENAPTVIQELPPSQGISVGAFHACALTAAEAWCWGQNTDGQLGDGTLRDHDEPMRVVGF